MVLCRPKEAELDEETPTKRPRKRTASESLPKKPKLMKPTTGRYFVYCTVSLCQRVKYWWLNVSKYPYYNFVSETYAWLISPIISYLPYSQVQFCFIAWNSSEAVSQCKTGTTQFQVLKLKVLTTQLKVLINYYLHSTYNNFRLFTLAQELYCCRVFGRGVCRGEGGVRVSCGRKHLQILS